LNFIIKCRSSLFLIQKEIKSFYLNKNYLDGFDVIPPDFIILTLINHFQIFFSKILFICRKKNWFFSCTMSNKTMLNLIWSFFMTIFSSIRQIYLLNLNKINIRVFEKFSENPSCNDISFFTEKYYTSVSNMLIQFSKENYSKVKYSVNSFNRIN
jgi:hypothetical protein